MSQSIVGYAIGLAKLKPQDVKFVIMDGSAADGSDSQHSDYDIVVVREGLSKELGSVKDLFGVFNGRLVRGWLVDEDSFRHRCIGDDDAEFLWRKKGLSKARLLLGDKAEFDSIISKAISRPWNRRRQMAVIQYYYVTLVEYIGMILNKVEMHDDASPEFFQDGYIVATKAAHLVAALNKIDLDSDKTMYRQVFAEAKVKPPHFERDFGISSGLVATYRKKGDVLAAALRLVRWSRRTILDSFKQSKEDDPGFWQVVRRVKI